MPLSSLQVFSEFVYSTANELVAQEVNKFNAASNNALVLRSAANLGDYDDEASWKKIAGLVRRRNAYGSGAVSAVNIEQLLNSSVKVAAGTPPVSIDPGMLRWIQKSPEEAGVVIGQQLAEDSLADMLNTGLSALVSALTNVGASVVYDHTATGTLSLAALNSGAAKFGDRSQSIASWIMHSTQAHNLYGASIANADRLFSFGTVQVMDDGFGRPFIITDSPSLITSGVPDVYHTAGLVSGALVVEQNNDFDSNIETTNGDENIQRTYQAEWSYNLGMKGYTWDKANGGASPNDAALGTGTNWDKTATDIKDTAGVLVNTD